MSACACRAGVQRDNCPDCEGAQRRIDFAALRAQPLGVAESPIEGLRLHVEAYGWPRVLWCLAMMIDNASDPDGPGARTAKELYRAGRRLARGGR